MSIKLVNKNVNVWMKIRSENWTVPLSSVHTDDNGACYFIHRFKLKMVLPYLVPLY